MERKIGEIFEYNGTKLEVVEGRPCDGCVFSGRSHCFDLKAIILGYCGGTLRSDGKCVIFKKVEE